MSRMNAGIILAGQQPNIGASMEAGFDRGRKNRLATIYNDHGAGIAAGDQNALNALASFDPSAALGIQNDRQVMDIRASQDVRTGERHASDMASASQRRDILNAQEKRALEAHAAQMDAAARAAQAQRIEAGIIKGIALHQAGDLAGLNQHLQSVGEQPLQSLDQFPAVAARYGEALEVFKDVKEVSEGPEEPASMQALRMRAEEAGLKPGTPEYQDFMLAGGKTEKSSVVFGPDGKPIFAEGDAAKSAGGNLNELQSKNATFATRARGALQVLDQQADGAPLADQMSSRTNRILDKVPMGIGREFQGAEYQVAAAAGQEFLQAVLRKDTGAAITEQEQILYGQLYLPQPGDTPEVLEYRRQARERAVSAIEAGMTPEAIRAQEIALAKQSGVSILGGEAEAGVQDWMLNSDPSSWTEEQKAEAEKAWGLTNE